MKSSKLNASSSKLPATEETTVEGVEKGRQYQDGNVLDIFDDENSEDAIQL